MTTSEIKALVSLLDDDDSEVLQHVSQKINSLGDSILPLLEEVSLSHSEKVKKRLEGLIQGIHVGSIQYRLTQWLEGNERDLLEGMWIISTYFQPLLDKTKLFREVEQLYYEAWLEFRSDMHPVDQVKVLNSIIYNKLGFKPNTKEFHAPENSLLDRVIANRQGNPISLCVLYMLIAQRLKLPIYGVNLPNLFILTYKSNNLQFYINAFNKGLIFTRGDIDNYISQLNLPPSQVYYEPTDHLEIIRRVLRNLVASFEKLRDEEKAADMRTLLAVADRFSESEE